MFKKKFINSLIKIIGFSVLFGHVYGAEARAVSKLSVDEMGEPQIYGMGSFLNFKSDSNTSSLTGLTLHYEKPINKRYAVESSFTQAFSSEGVLSSVFSKFDFGFNYKVWGMAKDSSIYKYNGSDFAKVNFRPKRIISFGGGLSVSSFSLFDNSLVLTGIYVDSFYKEPLTEKLTLGTGVKFDYLITGGNVLHVVNMMVGLTYDFKV